LAVEVAQEQVDRDTPVSSTPTVTEYIWQENGVEMVSRQRERSKCVPRQDTRQRNTDDSEAGSRNCRGRVKIQTRVAAGKLVETKVFYIFFYSGASFTALIDVQPRPPFIYSFFY
jgi:hypothetical protein